MPLFDAIKAAIFTVAPYALVPPLLIGLLLFKQLPLALKWVWVHLLFAGLVEVLASMLWKYKVNNLFLLHLYTVEECGVIVWVYSRLFIGLIRGSLFLVAYLAFFVFAVVDVIFLQSLQENNTYVRTLEAIIVICCAVGYFYRMLIDTEVEHPARSPYFWINTGWLIYFSASLLLFAMSNYLIGAHFKQWRLDLWTLHAFFSILLYTFIAIGLWTRRKK